MRQSRPYPRLTITRKAARQLKSGHPWLYAGEVLHAEPAENGGIVDLFEENGTWQGAALLSQQSTIRARVVSRNANDRLDAEFWRRRIAWAWQHRMRTMGGRALPGYEPDTTCCRVVFSEADGMPGLVVDKYEDVLVTQVGTVGMERLRPVLYPLLIDTLQASGESVRGIYERNDGAVRDKEGIDRYKGWWNETPDVGEHIVIRENGIRYDLDIANSQKTGFFLDQKYNRRAVRRLADGRRVLDCFCHVGPFGLNALAGGAEYVRFVDASRTALDLVAENAALNGHADGSRWGATQADVLEYLPELRDRGRMREEGGPFDLIVLDPPAFAKGSRAVRNALRGYREINTQALRLLARGGYLATCSCSQHVTRDLLAQAVSEAAHATNRQLRQVEERQQAPDHPILWGFPESHYLDFFVFQVV